MTGPDWRQVARDADEMGDLDPRVEQLTERLQQVRETLANAGWFDDPEAAIAEALELLHQPGLLDNEGTT
jgi:hypothetical protein